MIIELRAKALLRWFEEGMRFGLVLLSLVTVAAESQAEDFTYSIANGAITITGYTGPGGDVTIPNTITGLPVISVGQSAFFGLTNLTSVTIPNGVTDIGDQAFGSCSSLASVTILDSPINIGYDSFGYCALTNLSLGNNARSIGQYAFAGSYVLTNVTIPVSVTNISGLAFARNGPGHLNIFFQANAPSSYQEIDLKFPLNGTVYYLPATTGWGQQCWGCSTVLWNPRAQTSDAGFGFHQNRFGFNITGTQDIPLVVEASTSLVIRSWVRLQSCTLTNGLIYFSDAQWTNHPGQVYRIQSP